MKQDLAMYKKIDIDYDKDHFLKLFHDSRLDPSRKVFVEAINDLPNDPEVIKLLERFPFIRPDAQSISLIQLRKEMRPYINEGNNGAIVIPVWGTVDYSFYSYPGTIVNGRPHLPPDNGYDEALIPEIKSTLIETVAVDKPMAFNGLVTHSYSFTRTNPIYLLFKIPPEVSWDDVVAELGA